MNLTEIIGIPFLVILLTFFYNEYFIYYHTLADCNWPKPNLAIEGPEYINMMLIADTHLLGSRNGHWFDKLRREWQQHRAFQTARYYLQPDYIVIMGDLTDEGKWCSDWEWEYYEKRVQELFYTDDNNNTKKTELIVIVGNHDVGFHYDIIDRKIERFNRTYKAQFAQLFYPTQKNDVNFLILNSMTLENDNCKFCKGTQKQLKRINKTLECLQMQANNATNLPKNCLKKQLNGKKYSRPILFTHFPLYRKSDAICPQTIDSESALLDGIKPQGFKEKYDCLSRESTDQILKQMNPRLVFNGHTHFSCFNELHGLPEYTIASFSWRNIQTPSMILLQVNGEEHFVEKCFLPAENNVIMIYGACAVFIFIYYLSKIVKMRLKKRSMEDPTKYHKIH